MQSITINTALRTDRPKDGLYGICVRVIINRKKIEVRIPHYIRSCELLANGAVKKSCFNSWAINQDIQNCLNDINQIILFHRANNLTITKESFNNLFRKKLDTSTLHNYIRTQAKLLDICKRRLDVYNVLAGYIQKHFPKTSLSDCSYDFLISLKRKFVSDNYMPNTIASNFSKLKAIINNACRQKLIPENPFKNFKIGSFESTRQFLSKEELLRIEKYYTGEISAAQKNICKIFLFLCYTGMRIGDFQRMQHSDISDGCIRFVQGKTKTTCVIPISQPAMRFLNESDFDFYKIAPQKINLGLKDVATGAAITKPLTCHVARHTFATLSLQLEMNINSISKILGHSKLATTMIYAKVLEETKKTEMKKWNGFLGFQASGSKA